MGQINLFGWKIRWSGDTLKEALEAPVKMAALAKVDDAERQAIKALAGATLPPVAQSIAYNEITRLADKARAAIDEMQL